MLTSALQVGFVYVLTNESLPGIVKIGVTSDLPEDRSHKLYTTGVPTPFDVAFRATTSRPEEVERKTHKLLKAHRINPRREFFKVSVDDAIEAVRLALVEEAGIHSWRRPEGYILANGDRLSLTLEAGQVFALVGYKSLSHVFAGKAEPLDLWQAHSDCDELEIYVNSSPRYVAGFSDGDGGGTDDPVPHLNREGTAANGLINGLERLMPGERLVWIPAPENAEVHASVVFEARDYCQIVSRTWSPVTGSHGFPLLLNDFQHEEVWPEAKRAIRTVLALPVPRDWAPRDERDLSWAPVGIEPASPEHWLPQLKPKLKKALRRDR
jgi:hypothetical protein